MKNWKILRDCRQEGDGLHHAVQAVPTMHNLAMARGSSRPGTTPASSKWTFCTTLQKGSAAARRYCGR
ncbi:hypothetical protein [Streptomyces sp. NRRL F-2664]|uniref:hypothetical protein n=1 Tax=Streptomyces sp. NRRL F-2664 TaxID=1463842 RepID=UPI000AAB5617